MKSYHKIINLCEAILDIAYTTNNDLLEFIAHELKSTIEIQYEEE